MRKDFIRHWKKKRSWWGGGGGGEEDRKDYNLVLNSTDEMTRSEYKVPRNHTPPADCFLYCFLDLEEACVFKDTVQMSPLLGLSRE